MSHPHPSRFLLATASLVVIIAGLKVAAPLLTTFLLALFLTMICLPALRWLQKRQVGEISSVALLFLLLLLIGALLALLLGSSVADFTRQIPLYQQRLDGQKAEFLQWLTSYGITLDADSIKGAFDPASAMGMAGTMLTSLGRSLANLLLILLTTLFLLFEARALPQKWQQMSGHAPSSEIITRFLDSANRYLVVKTWISLLTGVLVTILLILVGVDYPLLWGVLSFLFNFVPNIGSIVAAIPAILLTLVQLGGAPALIVTGGYMTINMVVGNLVEPRFMGREVGLSPLVVFLSLVCWGWILGPVGMLLSVPLTMVVKLALESNPQWQWLATLLGSAHASSIRSDKQQQRTVGSSMEDDR
ncbi:MAG: AI-2E family transporter [Mariprofundales bacterium]|nr:AI-2E family transporter [Mariprofundales bacterium]